MTACTRPSPRLALLLSAALPVLPAAANAGEVEALRFGTMAGAHAPLEYHPTHFGTQFITANHLPSGAAAFTFGTAQTDPSTAAGTGIQNYAIGAAYAVSDRLTFGLVGQYFEDPVSEPILGAFPTFGMDGVAGWGKYLVSDGPNLDISVEGSLEFFRLTTSVFGSATGSDAEHVVGSIRAPFTYAFSDALQGHVTPGVSFFPDSLNGIPFYGTVGYVGAGLSFKPNERVAVYGAVNVPVAGGNAVSSTATITDTPIWTVGGRYNATPKVAVDFYATNGLGMTPATSILSLWPGGDQVLFGAQLTVTPGRGPGYRPSYRSLRPLSPRELDLQQDGFTLASADTFEPGTLAGTAWYGSDENYGGGLVLAPERDLQFEAFVENYANDGTVPAMLLPSTELRYLVGGKLRLLDQNNGDSFSFAVRALGGRDLGTGTPGPGVLFLETPGSVKVTEQVALSAVPKLSAFGNTEIYGLGLGVNFALMDGLQLIGEVTPTDGGNGTVWAAGVRYAVPNTGFSVDAHATNAVGTRGIGTMVAQDSVKYSLSLTKRFDFSGWR